MKRFVTLATGLFFSVAMLAQNTVQPSSQREQVTLGQKIENTSNKAITPDEQLEGRFEKNGVGEVPIQLHTKEWVADLEQSLEVYPNPGNGLFTVRAINGQAITGVEVYDITGKRIQISTSTVFEDPLEREVDLTNHHEGVYIILVKFGQTAHALRVVKM
jgi:hypothetical protein